MKYNKKFIYYSFLIASLFSFVFLFLFITLCMSEEENELYSGFLGIDTTSKLLIGLGIVFLFISFFLNRFKEVAVNSFQPGKLFQPRNQ